MKSRGQWVRGMRPAWRDIERYETGATNGECEGGGGGI